MRFARIRRLLGPFEPAVVDGQRRVRVATARRLRPAVVVVATDAAHLDQARALVGDLGQALGVWLTATEDVTTLGSLGWFVVRLEPGSWTEATVDEQVEAVRRVVRVRRVIDLRR